MKPRSKLLKFVSVKLSLLLTGVLLMTACSQSESPNHSSVPSHVASATASAALVNSPSPASTDLAPVEEPPTENPNGEIDNSVRASGKLAGGQLMIQPKSQGRVMPLGAPSCFGQETDLRWTGDYEAVWKSDKGTSAVTLMQFHSNFEIIQPTDAPVELKSFTLGKHEFIAYVPRYTDCHAQETYFFGVGDDVAIPIPVEYESGKVSDHISQLPHRPFQIKNDELIVTGGYGAGDDFINVYHYRYDSKKHTLILHSADQVKLVYED